MVSFNEYISIHVTTSWPYVCETTVYAICLDIEERWIKLIPISSRKRGSFLIMAIFVFNVLKLSSRLSWNIVNILLLGRSLLEQHLVEIFPKNVLTKEKFSQNVAIKISLLGKLFTHFKGHFVRPRKRKIKLNVKLLQFYFIHFRVKKHDCLDDSWIFTWDAINFNHSVATSQSTTLGQIWLKATEEVF